MRWFILIIVTMTTVNVATAQQSPSYPNIVFIMADDLGYGDVGWQGGPYKTPHLDRLAGESVRLAQHYSLPVCSPTRSSLLSGRYNSRFGCTNPTNSQVFPFGTVTLATAFQSLGYETALVGKWHLGSVAECGPQHFGFVHSYGSLAGGVTSYTHLYKQGPYEQTWHRNGKPIQEAGHVTDLLTQEAVRFIEAQRARRFFLYVPYTAVHLPIDEPQKWLDLYADEPELGVRQYGACVSHLDDGVGQILRALEDTGLHEQTIVVFTSDNGGSIGTRNNDTKYAGTHPSFRIPAKNGVLRGGKATVYEGGIRTPAIISWPGHLESRDEPGPMHIADWFPTLAGIVGYEPKVDLKWDGENRWPILSGKAKAQPRVLYWLGPNSRSLALRQGDLVLIRQRDKPDELYDLASDVRQECNLAASRPETVQSLSQILEQVSARDNDAQALSKKPPAGR